MAEEREASMYLSRKTTRSNSSFNRESRKVHVGSSEDNEKSPPKAPASNRLVGQPLAVV
jgi:hypothetical protein